MLKAFTIKRLLFILLIIALFTVTSCATSKKNTFYTKKKQASIVNASQLGRNKYYFSNGYQKKLTKGYKK
jgi:hypothetical protein